MLTLEQSDINNFPFTENEEVTINWKYPEPHLEKAIITKIFTSHQGGRTVAHALMVKPENGKEQTVCASLLTKKK